MLVKYAIYAIVGTLSFGFFFLLIIVVLFVFNWVHTGSGSDGRHSLAHTYMLRIAGILVVSVRVVLLQPMLTVLLLATLCTTDGFHIQIDGLGYDCSGSLQTILMVLGILTAVLLISAVALTIVFFADEDPRSRLPWACGSRAVDAYKLIRKAVTSLGVYVATGNSAVGTAIIAVCLILSVLIMMSLYNQLYMQDRNLLYITITTEGLVTWLTLLLVAQTISDVDWLHPVGMGVFVAVFLVCVVLAYRSRCANFMRRHSIESFKRADDVETYSRILLDHLRISKTGDDPTVNGFIQMHFLSCKNDRCPCRKRTDCCDRTEEEVKLQSGNEKEVEEADVGFKKSKSAMDFDAGTKKGNVVVKSEAAADRAKTEVLKIVINSLEAWKERHESSARFDIYLGHLKSAVWKNRLAALYEVMCAQNESPSVYELFMAYRLTYCPGVTRG